MFPNLKYKYSSTTVNSFHDSTTAYNSNHLSYFKERHYINIYYYNLFPTGSYYNNYYTASCFLFIIPYQKLSVYYYQSYACKCNLECQYSI